MTHTQLTTSPSLVRPLARFSPPSKALAAYQKGSEITAHEPIDEVRLSRSAEVKPPNTSSLVRTGSVLALGVAMLGLFGASPVQAAEPVTPSGFEQAGRELRQTGVEIGRQGKAVGQEAAKVGKQVGQEAAKVGKQVGQEAAKVGKQVGQEAAQVGKEIGRQGAELGKGVGRAARSFWKGLSGN